MADHGNWGVRLDCYRLSFKEPPESKKEFVLDLRSALVRVRDVGRGDRTIVFTPDAPVVLENYDTLIALLAPHARVICFEFPGCGFSVPREGYDFSLESAVTLLGEILEALDVRRATLAFTCVNSFVAMAYAKRHPERVDRLALAQIASHEEMEAFAKRIDLRIAGLRLMATPVLGQVVSLAARKFIAHRWFASALPKDFDVDKIWDVTRPVMQRGGQFCLASILQGYLSTPPHSLEQLDVHGIDARIRWGMADRTHRRTNKQSILQHMPQAEIEELPERGHCLDLEAPKAHAAWLLKS